MVAQTLTHSLYRYSVARELNSEHTNEFASIGLAGGKETIADKEQPLFTIVAHANSPRFYGVVVMLSPVMLILSVRVLFS